MRQHTDWLRLHIESIPALEAKTFVSVVRYPAPRENEIVAPPYVVIHPQDGTDELTRYSGHRATQKPVWTLHSVGVDEFQASAIAASIKNSLVIHGIGVIPVIEGENPRRVWWESPTPVQIDRDFKPPLLYHVARVGFTSDLI